MGELRFRLWMLRIRLALAWDELTGRGPKRRERLARMHGYDSAEEMALLWSHPWGSPQALEVRARIAAQRLVGAYGVRFVRAPMGPGTLRLEVCVSWWRNRKLTGGWLELCDALDGLMPVAVLVDVKKRVTLRWWRRGGAR